MGPESDYCVHVTDSLFSLTYKKEFTPVVLNGNTGKRLNAQTSRVVFQFCICKTNEAKPCCNDRRGLS